MSRIAFYVTGHGFGHAVRAITVMNALAEHRPSLDIYIRSLAPARLFEENLRASYTLEPVQTDTGGFERNILFTDEEKTITIAREFHARVEPIVESEVDFLRREGIKLVLNDVPPLASEIAFQAGIPSIAFANFTWDRTYADYPGSAGLVEQLAAYYRKTTLALEIPLGHPVTTFPRRQRIPIIARHSAAQRDAVRRELGIDNDRIAVQVGLKGPELDGRALESADPRIVFLTTTDVEGAQVRRLEPRWAGRFPDVMVASDVVLTKPGYGVIAECLANRRPALLLPRMGFAETAWLIKDIEGRMPYINIDLDGLAAGRLTDSILRLYEKPFDWPETRTDGAHVAAGIVLGILEGKNGI